MNNNKKQNWVQIPTKEAGSEEWSRFFNALGRPIDADAYEFNETGGDFYDTALAENFRKLCHQAGLNAQQAAILHDGMVKILMQRQQNQKAEIVNEKQRVVHHIREKWGNDYAFKLKKAQDAAAYFGFKEQEINQLEEIIGSEAVLDGFVRIGEGMAQDTALMDIQPQSSLISADSAKKKRAELSRDESFLEALMDKAHPNHQAAIDEINKLNQIIVG